MDFELYALALCTDYESRKCPALHILLKMDAADIEL